MTADTRHPSATWQDPSNMQLRLLDHGRSRTAFWFGCLLVTAGVVLHLPMYLMARDTGFILAGMRMDAGMLWGMLIVVAGIGLAGYGLLPRGLAPPRATAGLEWIAPPEDAPLTAAHWGMAVLLAVALIIDIMKPASLGFVTPGMRAEYGVGDAVVAWLPFAALTGTALGSFLWGWLADVYGRRAAILLSSVMFIGTSICGAMPDFWLQQTRRIARAGAERRGTRADVLGGRTARRRPGAGFTAAHRHLRT
jgi:MFS transporter, putative metabolite:H+ symporter